MDERKRKRLEAWKKKQESKQANVPKVSLKIGLRQQPKTKKRKAAVVVSNAFGALDDSAPEQQFKEKDPLLNLPTGDQIRQVVVQQDTTTTNSNEPDELDAFMNTLQNGPSKFEHKSLRIDSSGSTMNKSNDWLSEASEDEETEQGKRRQLIQALVQQQRPTTQSDDLEADDGILDEGERQQELSKLEVLPNGLVELNKKKELLNSYKGDFAPFQKNLYRVPRTIAALSQLQVTDLRVKLKIRVRGKQAPAPVSTFAQLGLPVAVLEELQRRKIENPYPIQAQAIPAILNGRDVIGIAKTGSGKTLAYVLPLLRHVVIQDSPGVRGIILAPARELAVQIYSVCKTYAKHLGLSIAAVYGGAGVAEQIADIKRSPQVIVATPGRLIDFLTLQHGKLLDLQYVTFCVMDEADRMFDMGFAPQISAIFGSIRPDRQVVLFSATFPKQIEKLARQYLKAPLEIMVGGRSVASNQITQFAELVEEGDKFLRLLQILGEHVEGTNKVIVFVDTQIRADALFEKLLRNGYSTLSLHGGKEQEDRDSTISDFKRRDGPNILVATGVAARGLDVAACTCVVNFCAPNHLEAYVHQAGRTGRAGNHGTCYTLVSPEEERFAPIVSRALHEAGQAENLDAKLKELSEAFTKKVKAGEARYAGSGFKGKGFTYESGEMNEFQRVAKIEKRAALIEAGLMDAEEDDLELVPKKKAEPETTKPVVQVPETLTPELLAQPGMREALLRKAGVSVASVEDTSGQPTQVGENQWCQDIVINDYPREARWKVTQKETTSRMQDEFRTGVTLKGSFFPPGRSLRDGDQKLRLHLQATSSSILRAAAHEIQRLLNEETLKVAANGGLQSSATKYNVLG